MKDVKDRVQFIKDNIDLSELIILLYKKEIKPQGTSNCPFCNKKNKWFSIKNKVGWCYSSSCPSKTFSKYKTISVIDIYKEYRNINFHQTIQELEEHIYSNKKINIREDVDRLDRRHEFLSRALSVYHQQLWDPSNKSGIEYLRSRGFKDISIQNAGIGFVSLNECLIINGFSINSLIEEGLYNEEYRQEYYRANRIIFPLKDTKGRLIHLQSRYIKHIPKDDKGDELWPRYKATKKVEGIPSITKCLFFKERTQSYLYRENKDIYISEGIPDTLSLVQLGIPAVGMLGINNLLEHTEYISTFSNIIVIGDNDRFNKNHLNYPKQYKSWRVLTPQLIQLQQALGNKSIYCWMPPKYYKGKKIKDVNDLLRSGITKEELLSLIDNHKWNLIRFVIQTFRKDLSKHEEIIRLIKASDRNSLNYNYFSNYLDRLNISPLEYAFNIING